MDQEKVWDLLSKSWQKYRTRTKNEIIEFLESIKGKILDIGCGSGRNFHKIEGIKWHGCDFSEEMLKYARKKAEELNLDIEIKKAKAEDTKYEDNFFEGVIFNAVLQCIDSKSGKEASLKEIYRILKPGGRAFISTWGPKAPRIKGRFGEIEVPWTIKGKKYQRYTYIYKFEELESLLKKIGFEIEKAWEEKNINFVVRKD